MFTVMNNSGVAVKREAAKALEQDTQAALRTFLEQTQYTAHQEDEKVAVFSILNTASPEVKKYAQRALDDGSPEAIHKFLLSGQYIARARDEETATISQLVDIVEREGKRAQLQTEKAVAASDRAKEAAEKAKAAALKAAEEAKAAKDDVRKSANAANNAASATRGAADADEIARLRSELILSEPLDENWLAMCRNLLAVRLGPGGDARAYVIDALTGGRSVSQLNSTT
ncbi:ALF repeat-containing protein [Streptomyces sp. NPDC052236]|uniref:ALF repeat-containing protein n=1 Tax=Streptomyces sp. NPDC052236 TaxID=3365686 RepID=UPI0037D2DA50